mgnify:CR=1 FL=1
MNKQQERDIYLIGLALFLALSAAVQPHSDVHYKLQEITAVALLAAGVAFALMGLLLPPMGTIHDSVLWVFAQCLIYAGSVLGVTGFLKSSRGVEK